MNKCPKCGRDVVYVGLNEIECSENKAVCPNGSWSWRERLKETVQEAQSLEAKQQQDNEEQLRYELRFRLALRNLTRELKNLDSQKQEKIRYFIWIMTGVSGY